MKNPCVAFSMRTLGPGLIARVLSLVSSWRTSIAPSSNFSLVKHNLQHRKKVHQKVTAWSQMTDANYHCFAVSLSHVLKAYLEGYLLKFPHTYVYCNASQSTSFIMLSESKSNKASAGKTQHFILQGKDSCYINPLAFDFFVKHRQR